MLIVEILIALGIACIATALLGTLTDEDGDRSPERARPPTFVNISATATG
jgi:hypothetical protein